MDFDPSPHHRANPSPGATPRPAQRAAGFAMGCLATGFAIWLWRDGLQTGAVRPALALFGAFAVIGFALVLIPGYREERLARGEDISSLQGNQLVTRRWWIVLVLALAVGGGLLLALGWQLRS